MAKKNIVMFLGAGASKAFKYPLTKEILMLIVKEINSGTLFSDDDLAEDNVLLYRQLLKSLLTSLSPGIEILFSENKKIDENKLPLITDLLSQAEHLFNTNHTLVDFNFELPKHSVPAIESLNERWSLKDVITLLEWAIIKVINNSGNKKNARLQDFINWVKKTNTGKDAFVSIVTSNYDCSMEWNLMEDGDAYCADTLIDYGFNWREVGGRGEIFLRPADPRYRFFKLHGSIDWLKCERCGYIYINPTQDIYDLAFTNIKTSGNTCHCGYWPLAPVLVTPSFSRTAKDTNLSQIWRNTSELLRTAEEWMIVGYSLPGEDLDIKSLFIRALKGRTSPPVIKVIQHPDSTSEKYDYFFGVNNYEFIDCGFENYKF